jgi:hypothetical protein
LLEDAVIRAGFDLFAGMAWDCGAAVLVVNDPMFRALFNSATLLSSRRFNSFAVIPHGIRYDAFTL